MRIAVLGATGAVGQKAVALLQHHPTLELAEVCSRQVGARYWVVVDWMEPGRPPDLPIKSPYDLESEVILSALPTTIAKTLEPELVAKGHRIFTNASAHRMSSPLIIPEINGHLLDDSPIIANSNCSVAVIALALYPLLKLGEIVHIHVVTMQARSGAGHRFHMEETIHPFIAGEEEKIVQETRRILDCDLPLTIQVNRIPITYGHIASIYVQYAAPPENPDYSANHYKVYTDPLHPQPADLTWDDMRIHVGRIRREGRNLSLVALGHNLVRGAAGAAIANIMEMHRSL